MYNHYYCGWVGSRASQRTWYTMVEMQLSSASPTETPCRPLRLLTISTSSRPFFLGWFLLLRRRATMTLQAVMLVLLGLLAVLPTTSASRLTLINLNVNTAGLSIYTPCDSIAVFPCTTTELSVCLSLSLFTLASDWPLCGSPTDSLFVRVSCVVPTSHHTD